MYAGILAPYNHTGLTGKEYDAKTGLIDFGARWYDPFSGRFAQADTYKGQAGIPATQHAYAYTGNNPINRIDPTGHETVNIEYPDGSTGTVELGDDDRTYYDDGTGVRDYWEGQGYEVDWDGSTGTVIIREGNSGGGGSSGGGGDDDGGGYTPPPPTPAQLQASFNASSAAAKVTYYPVKTTTSSGQPKITVGMKRIIGDVSPEADKYEENRNPQNTQQSSWSQFINSVGRISTSLFHGASQAIVEDYSYGLSTTQMPRDYNPTVHNIGKQIGHNLVISASIIEGTVGSIGGIVTSPSGVGAVAGAGAVVHAGSVWTSASINKARDQYVYSQTSSGGNDYKLPGSKVGESKHGVIEHYYNSGDHGPAHVHVIDKNNNSIRVGQNGKPLSGDGELNRLQSKLVTEFKKEIRDSVTQIMKWYRNINNG